MITMDSHSCSHDSQLWHSVLILLLSMSHLSLDLPYCHYYHNINWHSDLLTFAQLRYTPWIAVFLLWVLISSQCIHVPCFPYLPYFLQRNCYRGNPEIENTMGDIGKLGLCCKTLQGNRVHNYLNVLYMVIICVPANYNTVFRFIQSDSHVGNSSNGYTFITINYQWMNYTLKRRCYKNAIITYQYSLSNCKLIRNTDDNFKFVNC